MLPLLTSQAALLCRITLSSVETKFSDLSSIRINTNVLVTTESKGNQALILKTII